MTSLTVENYLKSMLQITLREDVAWVATGQLATALAVSPGTVTSMIKSLAESGLAEYRPYEGVRLTDHGREVALRMLRRHRLLELFLVKTLDLTWDQVHEEAENMEHAVSDFLVDRIDEYLGRPDFDPHGDPIPSADGTMRGGDAPAASLVSMPAGARIRIARVTNQHADFLRYLSETGLELGTEGIVRENRPEAGIVTAEIAGRPVTLGHTAAEQILVEPLG
uniref:Transcriptional regulator MntR n=1 Tax=Schlesneria paludicola TaxID=360056 RepID=A0A7C2K0V1_9PLAN